MLFAADENHLAGLRTGDGNVKRQQRFPKIRLGVPGTVTRKYRYMRCARWGWVPSHSTGGTPWNGISQSSYLQIKIEWYLQAPTA